MIFSGALFMGRHGEIFPHIYDMNDYVYSREAVERLVESLLEAVFQSIVFFIGSSFLFTVSLRRWPFILSVGTSLFGLVRFILKV